jgi:Protein of unknown function (DUF3891)
VVLRRDHRGVLAIGQPAHAWICGQLARAWGNERFGAVEPLGEVALGAEQHDIGMARWDLEPALNPGTGMPQSFMEMELEANLELWRHGPVTLISQSRYGALLAAMHGRRLYERHDLEAAPAPRAAAITAFLAQSRELEAWLTDSLRADPATAGYATPELIARNSQLVWTWDILSLVLLINDWMPPVLQAVPAAGGEAVDVRVDAHGEPDGVATVALDPWPFSAPAVRVRCEGRRLVQRFATQAELAEGFAQAPWETVEFGLVCAAR